MKKINIGRFAITAAAVAAIAFAAAGPASANGSSVNWANKMTGQCLNYPIKGTDYVSMGSCDAGLGLKWWSDDIHPEHGNNWIEYTTWSDGRARCLDSNARGSVYISYCDAPSQYNKYQFWSEEKWNGGWVLKNVATGRCLAVDGDDVHTLPCDANNKYQFWE
ncbi:RICIN domain-containing protein [Kitasatospora sp. NPDC001683]